MSVRNTRGLRLAIPLTLVAMAVVMGVTAPAQAGEGYCIANSSKSKGSISVSYFTGVKTFYTDVKPGKGACFNPSMTPRYGLPFGSKYLHSTSNQRLGYLQPGAYLKLSATSKVSVVVKK